MEDKLWVRMENSINYPQSTNHGQRSYFSAARAEYLNKQLGENLVDKYNKKYYINDYSSLVKKDEMEIIEELAKKDIPFIEVLIKLFNSIEKLNIDIKGNEDEKIKLMTNSCLHSDNHNPTIEPVQSFTNSEILIPIYSKNSKDKLKKVLSYFESYKNISISFISKIKPFSNLTSITYLMINIFDINGDCEYAPNVINTDSKFVSLEDINKFNHNVENNIQNEITDDYVDTIFNEYKIISDKISEKKQREYEENFDQESWDEFTTNAENLLMGCRD